MSESLQESAVVDDGEPPSLGLGLAECVRSFAESESGSFVRYGDTHVTVERYGIRAVLEDEAFLRYVEVTGWSEAGRLASLTSAVLGSLALQQLGETGYTAAICNRIPLLFGPLRGAIVGSRSEAYDGEYNLTTKRIDLWSDRVVTCGERRVLMGGLAVVAWAANTPLGADVPWDAAWGELRQANLVTPAKKAVG